MVGLAEDEVKVHLPDERLVVVDAQLGKERLSDLDKEREGC